MKAHYGYADGSGEYFITIDTDLCDGCGECVAVCPRSVLVVCPDDYDEPKAMVRPELSKTLAEHCPGIEARCNQDGPRCQDVCAPGAIRHSF